MAVAIRWWSAGAGAGASYGVGFATTRSRQLGCSYSRSSSLSNDSRARGRGRSATRWGRHKQSAAADRRWWRQWGSPAAGADSVLDQMLELGRWSQPMMMLMSASPGRGGGAGAGARRARRATGLIDNARQKIRSTQGISLSVSRSDVRRAKRHRRVPAPISFSLKDGARAVGPTR